MSVQSLSSRHLLKIALLANTFEWYEFAVYAFLSGTLSQLFFAENDATVNLLKAFMVLALGYFARPFGSWFFGLQGDRLGRRIMLRLSLALMAVPTAVIGILPTYEQAGFWASLLLCLMRVLQGFAMGGELPAAACYVFESANKKYKSLLCSTTACAPGIGMLLAALVNYLLVRNLDQTQILAWGWRIPFLASIPLSLFIAYVRNQVQETPAFKALQSSSSPEETNPRVFILQLIKLFCLFGFFNVTVVCTKIYMPTYLSQFLGVPVELASFISVLILGFHIFLYFLFGYLANRLGYQRVLITSIFATFFLVLPVFIGLRYTSSWLALLGLQWLLACLMASHNALFVEVAGNLFNTSNRALGISLGCTLPAALIGGSTPFVLTYVIEHTGWLSFPAFYIMVFAVLALPVAWGLLRRGALKY
jgi:MFS transporter, MHS family, proline/betaine transporter